jgi:hypothetical protein
VRLITSVLGTVPRYHLEGGQKWYFRPTAIHPSRTRRPLGEHFPTAGTSSPHSRLLHVVAPCSCPSRIPPNVVGACSTFEVCGVACLAGSRALCVRIPLSIWSNVDGTYPPSWMREAYVPPRWNAKLRIVSSFVRQPSPEISSLRRLWYI